MQTPSITAEPLSQIHQYGCKYKITSTLYSYTEQQYGVKKDL